MKTKNRATVTISHCNVKLSIHCFSFAGLQATLQLMNAFLCFQKINNGMTIASPQTHTVVTRMQGA